MKTPLAVGQHGSGRLLSLFVGLEAVSECLSGNSLFQPTKDIPNGNRIAFSGKRKKLAGNLLCISVFPDKDEAGKRNGAFCTAVTAVYDNDSSCA